MLQCKMKLHFCSAGEAGEEMPLACNTLHNIGVLADEFSASTFLFLQAPSAPALSVA